MATRTYVQLTDDLTGEGGDDIETYPFGWGSKSYEIDLTKENGQEFYELISTYIEKARPVKAPGGGWKTRKAPGGGGAKVDREQSKAMRDRWNEAHPDDQVGNRGRVPQRVVDWFNAA